jgi:hypothetical protein
MSELRITTFFTVGNIIDQQSLVLTQTESYYRTFHHEGTLCWVFACYRNGQWRAHGTLGGMPPKTPFISRVDGLRLTAGDSASLRIELVLKIVP